MQTVQQVESFRQEPSDFSESALSRADKRLLLSASLQLFLHRIRRNLNVNRSDLVRLADLGEDDSEIAA